MSTIQDGLFSGVHGHRVTDCKSISELNAWIKSSNCDRCDFHKTRKNFVVPVGECARRIVILGHGPGTSENNKGIPNVGRAGAKLAAVLRNLGIIYPYDVHATNLVKCWGGKVRGSNDDRHPTQLHIKACDRIFAMELRILNPLLILALGATCWQAVCKPKVHLVSGSYIPPDKTRHGYPVYLAHHPAWSLRKKGAAHDRLFHEFQGAIAMLQKLERGECQTYQTSSY